MSRIDEDFRVRIANAGASTVAGNVAFTIDSVGTDTDGWLRDRGMQRWGGQEIQPLEGKVVSLSWTVEVGESQSGEEFVGNIGNASGRADMPLRLGDVSRSTDGGSTWTVQTTARLVDIEMVQPGAWALRFVDERVVERETEIFSTTDTTAVWPMGPREDWADVDRAFIAGMNVVQVSGDVVIMEPFASIAPGRKASDSVNRQYDLPRRVKQAIIDDLREDIDPAQSGNSFDPPPFETLKADIFPESALPDLALSNRVQTSTGGTADENKTTEIATHTDLITEGGANVGVESGPIPVTFEDLSFVWPANQPSVGDNYGVRLYFDGHETTDVVPRHIGGTGTHAVQIAKDLLSDAGVKINGSRFDALIANKEIPEVSFRVTQPENLAAWLEKHIWQPFGILPLVNSSGQVSPRRVYQTDADEVPDVTTLTSLTESVVTEAPAWRQGTDQQVTRLEWAWASVDNYRASKEESPPASMGGDALRIVDKTASRTHDRLDSGEVQTKTRRMSLAGIHDKKTAGGIADNMSRRIFNRYGDGAILTDEVPALSDVPGVSEGDYVVVNVPVYPDPKTGGYGGARVLQVTSKQYSRGGAGPVMLDLLDAGPQTQPLTKPTLTVSQSSSLPTQAIDVAVSLPSAATGSIVQAAANATEPAADSALWQDVAVINGTVTGLASGTTYWFRARATAPNRISSLWSDAKSASTASLTAPSSVSFTDVSGCSWVTTWTNGVTDRPVRLNVTGGNVDFTTFLKRGTTRFEVHDGLVAITTSTTYTVEVAHVDGFGGEVTASANVTTTGTADTGPDPLGISVLVGRSIQ